MPKNEAHREKRLEKNGWCDRWDNIKHSNIHVIRVESRRQKKNIWRNNGRKFCKCDENYNATNIRSSTNPSRINLKETTLQKNHIQLLTNSDKEKIVKTVKEKISWSGYPSVRQSRLYNMEFGVINIPTEKTPGRMTSLVNSTILGKKNSTNPMQTLGNNFQLMRPALLWW